MELKKSKFHTFNNNLTKDHLGQILTKVGPLKKSLEL